ncbi:Hypothetical predicted protein [Octopus vulgaris]|uniref:Uncharacterized protein n=1 Tax=Octopus vulgaris TaxID=6645 RepID=A0AA36AZJ8_OCTVU|nr:Hypothetical predicted protein [Octopus vulgaris]
MLAWVGQFIEADFSVTRCLSCHQPSPVSKQGDIFDQMSSRRILEMNDTACMTVTLIYNNTVISRGDTHTHRYACSMYVCVYIYIYIYIYIHILMHVCVCVCLFSDWECQSSYYGSMFFLWTEDYSCRPSHI